MNPILPHTHNNTDSPKLYAYECLENAPQDALTPASSGTLTASGITGLLPADNAILNNLITRVGELETKLRTLGLIK